MTDNPRPITLAVAALGGQGGGVLSGWIVKTAENCGYIAQYTSVPGVAQRTGATIYCIELFPKAAAVKEGKLPVLALTPMPGDVDIVIAAELMEAGRAVSRGFVTPDVTTLITSTHREYAISEKSAMGDGIADAEVVLKVARDRAKRLVAYDMKAAAEAAGSVISSALFGALAGSGALPFPRSAFEDTIRAGGRMVETNLASFANSYERAQSGQTDSDTVVKAVASTKTVESKQALSKPVEALLERIRSSFPAAIHPTLIEGARRCVDYQDPAYGQFYLDRLDSVLSLDSGPRGYVLTETVARYLALWMSYEDTIRVADLKTRGSRFERAQKEVRVKPDQIVYLTEFMHPRVEEIADTLPAPIGRYIMASPRLQTFMGRFTKKGRHIRTAKLSGFLLLAFLSSLRRIRRSTLRYKVEQARIEDWLGRVKSPAASDYDFAVEIARCQRLVKGYGDTHMRGLKNFAHLMDASETLAGRKDAARVLSGLRNAALADDVGETLQKELETLSSKSKSVA